MAALRPVLPLASIRRAASRATSSATSGTPKKSLFHVERRREDCHSVTRIITRVSLIFILGGLTF